MFEIINDEKLYFEKFKDFSIDQEKIPLFIDPKREDLLKISRNLSMNDYMFKQIVKCDLGMILSREVMSYTMNADFCRKWIDTLEEMKQASTLLIIGLYKDFTQKKVLEILEHCRAQGIAVYLLLGRDLSSLSWMVSKQFLRSNAKKCGVFSYKKLPQFKQRTVAWNLFGSQELSVENIKEILERNKWNVLVFHGHGKEDHLNLNDFTLHGFNRCIKWDGKFAPSWGHPGQKFFKDEKKAIMLSSIKAEKVFLLSCSNFPFSDARLYGARYNLVLNAIDGVVRNIVASLAVQSADLPELSLILQESDMNNISDQLQESLSDIQPFVSLVTIGLPDEIPAKKMSSPVARETDLTKLILSRLSIFSSSTMLDSTHPIKKWARKILTETMQYTRRGTIGTESEDTEKFEKELRNRVNPFSKEMGMLFQKNSSDQLADFDSFNIYRSVMNKSSISDVTCDCGRIAKNCDYLPETSNVFKLNATYCYLCGDKLVSMIGMPQIKFSCDEYNEKGLQINYKIEITPQYKGDVFILVQVPRYIEKYVEKTQLKKICFNTLRTVVIDGKIKIDKDIPLQSYYLKLIVIQNAGLAISRCFFNLVEN